MLGSHADADDAVQEAWLRLSRSNAEEIESLGGWLTTVVSRVCLDMLRARTSKREDFLDEVPPGQAPVSTGDGADPEGEAVLADAMGPALLVVLDSLAPAERLAFVLHDLFGVRFDEIAPIVGRSQAATRQLASRARRRVRGANGRSAADVTRQKEIVDAFLAASRNGEFEKLVAVLDPDVVLRADQAVVETAAARPGAPKLAAEVRGASAVAKAFQGRARNARLAFIDGVPGAVWAPGGKPRVVFSFVIDDGQVAAIEMVGDPEAVAAMTVTAIEH